LLFLQRLNVVGFLERKIMSTHLGEDRLVRFVFEQSVLSDDQAAHLAGCRECQEQLQAWQQLQGELSVAQQSQPSPAAYARYAQLFSQAPPPPSPFKQVIQWANALLAWDSRQQPALQGVRSPVRTGYRLLYNTQYTEIDLMVTPHAALFNLEGEILS